MSIPVDSIEIDLISSNGTTHLTTNVFISNNKICLKVTRTHLSSPGNTKCARYSSSKYTPPSIDLSQNWPCASRMEYGRITWSYDTWRGSLTLSNPSASKTVVVFLIPSLTFEAKSKKPIAVLVGNPTIPLPIPLKKPEAPSELAPSIGAVAIPVNPELTESKNELAPEANP